MRKLVYMTVLGSLFLLGACTTREMATGAAVGTAGYIVGKETAD